MNCYRMRFAIAIAARTRGIGRPVFGAYDSSQGGPLDASNALRQGV